MIGWKLYKTKKEFQQMKEETGLFQLDNPVKYPCYVFEYCLYNSDPAIEILYKGDLKNMLKNLEA